MRNSEVAEVLYEIADFLELEDVEWKPRAYRRAAQTIETLPKDIQEVYEDGELKDIPGVGESIAEKIQEYLETGSLEYLEELREKLPEGLRDLMMIEGVGPKTAKTLYEKLQISNLDQLEAAAREKRIRKLKGFGEKTEQEILDGIKRYRSKQERFLLGYILPSAEQVKERLEALDYVSKVIIAGSLRRMRETIGDMDVLVVSEKPKKVMDFFTEMSDVGRVVSKGERKSTIVLTNSLQIDLMLIEEENFGAALQYFTGSKAHGVALRGIAVNKGLKLSEYGLVDRENGEKVAGEDEEGIYRVLVSRYIEPEMRENRGEIEAAVKGELPDLVKMSDIKGDLHTHSNWSEGAYSIEEMAKKAKFLGLKYIAMCDHTKSLPIARGLDEERFKERQKEIEKVNNEISGLTVLSGAEVNIDSEGKLDLKDSALSDLDFVIASIHSGFKQSESKMTERILSAIQNQNVDAIGHPTGRLIQDRPPYNVDLDKVFKAASDTGVIMEINAFPTRLDLSDVNILEAREYGVRFCIGTDSHSVDHLNYIRLGVAKARRGWLSKEDVVNTLTAKKLLKSLR